MSSVQLKNISKKYNENIIIEDLNLTIPKNSFTVIVGPSGCGKTTTLRLIAGLEKSSEGGIYFDNEDVTNVSAQKRDLALVFQNYALYPHMSVYDNIDFGLKNFKVAKEQRKQIVNETLKLVQLEKHHDKLPNQLSGGQRQRVALARAISKKPKIFLMDEPLSNLDAKLRVSMRSELVSLHKKLESTFIYITHDQVEALSMADYMVVLNEGQLMQAGKPKDIYERPENIFVAQFIGDYGMNVIKQNDYQLAFRGQKVKFEMTNKTDMEFKVQIIGRELLGEQQLYHATLEDGTKIKFMGNDQIEIGRENVMIYIEAKDLHYFNNQGYRINV